MEGQEPPPQVVEIYDPDTPQDKCLISPEFPDEPYGPTNILTPTIEWPRRTPRVSSQPDTYAHSMTGKSYEYSMTQLEIQVVLHPDVHTLAQGDFYQGKPNVLISIMTQFSLKAGLT